MIGIGLGLIIFFMRSPIPQIGNATRKWPKHIYLVFEESWAWPSCSNQGLSPFAKSPHIYRLSYPCLALATSSFLLMAFLLWPIPTDMRFHLLTDSMQVCFLLPYLNRLNNPMVILIFEKIYLVPLRKIARHILNARRESEREGEIRELEECYPW